jgi:hypothetical protein
MRCLAQPGVAKMMEPSFAKWLGKLLDDEVRFILVGGLAVTLHGYVRLTEDIDILIDPGEDNVARLIQSLGQFGEGFGGDLQPSDFTSEPGAIRIVEESESAVLDIFTQLAGLSFGDLVDGTETSEIQGRLFHYASKSQLIRIKSGSHREKDQLDVSALKQLIRDPGAFE